MATGSLWVTDNGGDAVDARHERAPSRRVRPVGRLSDRGQTAAHTGITAGLPIAAPVATNPLET